MRKQTLFAVVFLLLTSLALWTVPPVIAQTAGIPEITWTRLQVRADTLTDYKGDYDIWSWTLLICHSQTPFGFGLAVFLIAENTTLIGQGHAY